ncbi:MAG TPA: hypothetical protein EYP30_05665 [Archaeoglobaceae archaeon]|nr:hypothetical protein [Archaeoglobaceae archaeon]
MFSILLHPDVIKFLDSLPKKEKERLKGMHLRGHAERIEFADERYPEVIRALRRLRRNYGDLGYDGINGEKVSEYRRSLPRLSGEEIIKILTKEFGFEMGKKSYTHTISL